MTAPPKKQIDSPEHASKGYETIDAPAGATIRAGGYLLGTMFLVALVVAPLYFFYGHRESRQQERPATVIEAKPAPEAVGYPKLVTSEPQALADFRAREDVVLDSYGWVEKDLGIARMPVSRAIEIVAARGKLPSFPADAAAAPKPAAGPGGTR